MMVNLKDIDKGKPETSETTPVDGAQITDEEKAVAAKLDVSPEDYVKNKNKEGV